MHFAFPDDPMITSRGTKENEESCCALCKSRHVLISDVLCDDLDRKIGRLEQMLCPVDAHQNDILMRRVSAFALEQSGKVVLTHVHTL